MEQFTQKYTVVQLLENLPDGFEYTRTDWPLHITLADVFATDWSTSMLATQLESFAKTRSPFTSTAEKEALFGPDNNIKVVVLELTKDLYDLHTSLLGILKRGQAVFNSPQYTGKGFIAHSSVQHDKRLEVGEQVGFTSLSLIDMFPGGDPYRRKVIQTCSFKN